MTALPPLPADADLGAALGARLAAAARAHGPLVAATARLLHREGLAGHVCVALADWQGKAPFADAAPFPDAAAWRDQLLASGVADAGDDPRRPLPLVLDGGPRAYFLRQHRAEQQLRAWIAARLGGEPRHPPAAVRAALAASATPLPPDHLDWQLAAVVLAAMQPFAVLTGGPGTGKTTTVARLLEVLLRLEPGLRVVLAAPTGKAAARLSEALRARLGAGAAAGLAAIEARTLHRLLGYQPLPDGFRHGPDRPLPHDLVVVDEVSMADPLLLAQLCAALRPAARLLLVGDRDQLAAVAAGQVLGDLCRAAQPERGAGPRLAAWVAQATGMALPVQPDAPPLADAVVALRQNHRFARQAGIGAFAMALAERRPAAALQALQHGHADLVLQPDPDAALAEVAPHLLAALAAAADDPAAALQQLGRCRVLCATRHGPHGADGWNQRIEALLRRHGHRLDDAHYVGRPLLVTANDPQNGLWNGDLGAVVVRAGQRVACFPGDDAPRFVSLLRLPAHETAWATTVHKAQGSEFDEVLLAMPDQPGPLWQAALLYTGVTRARRRAVVCADPALLPAGLAHWPQRSSGLAAALGGAG